MREPKFEDRYLGLAYHLFSCDPDEEQFKIRMAASEQRELSEQVAYRIFLCDMLLNRGSVVAPAYFYPSAFISSGDLGYEFSEGIHPLYIYLLCTCVDALAGKARDYREFPQWLQMKSKDEGEAQTIEAILKSQNGDLSNASVFCKIAFQLYEREYLPVFGIQQAFRRFFQDLPLNMALRLLDTFKISEPRSQSTARTTREQTRWPAEPPNDWPLGRQLPEAMQKNLRLIADYFYGERRNPFTHYAFGWTPWSHCIWIENLESAPLSYEWHEWTTKDRCRDVWIRFDPQLAENATEYESLMLRLTVAVGWLNKLGYHLSDAQNDILWTHLIIRNTIHKAINEVRWVRSYLANPYEGESTMGIRWPSLAKTSFPSLQTVIDHVRDTPHSNGLAACIIGFMDACKKLENASQVPTVDQAALRTYWQLNEDVDREPWQIHQLFKL